MGEPDSSGKESFGGETRLYVLPLAQVSTRNEPKKHCTGAT